MMILLTVMTLKIFKGKRLLYFIKNLLEYFRYIHLPSLVFYSLFILFLYFLHDGSQLKPFIFKIIYGNYYS